jgi:peptide methionine sulfoxide reductase msrA/msrB
MYKIRQLTQEEADIIHHKGTETPFSGKFLNHKDTGIYVCKQCGAALYRSFDKFDSGCGWPAFDDEIQGAVRRIPDADGIRTEIVCNVCNAHLGHVFAGENLTDKNIRHCVNSLSLDFIPAKTGYVASGCFWGTEYFFRQAKGVLDTTVGFMGGEGSNPSYRDVVTGKTKFVETVRVMYDPDVTSYENLTRLFFETHDFTQRNGQGPDIGYQYRSVIFYVDQEQKEVALKYRNELKEMGFRVATSIEAASSFWPAEKYHQKYYEKRNGTPYCHFYRKIFKNSNFEYLPKPQSRFPFPV